MTASSIQLTPPAPSTMRAVQLEDAQQCRLRLVEVPRPGAGQALVNPPVSRIRTREATRMAEAGKLVPLLEPRRFTLETALEAQLASEAGTAAGKLVVGIQG
jgi:hypothetical protein